LPRSDNDRVKSLEKGLQLLLLLSGHPGALSLDKITQASGLNKTTCFRLIKTMQELGFVEQELNSKMYRLGPKNISLGAAAMQGLSLRRLALPYMQKLKDSTKETVNLSVLDGTEVVFIERLEASHILSTHHRIGDRLPAYCTCMGKAILAYLPEEKLLPILERIKFEAKTPRTVKNKKALLEELARIREEGLAFNREELEKGLCAVAAPIMGYAGEAVAGLNIAFPLTRHDERELTERFAPQVKEAAAAISRLLGYAKDEAA
jgi:PcaR/PcaU/PobR family beta-ketoadipate pathway transcriptional regulator